ADEEGPIVRRIVKYGICTTRDSAYGGQGGSPIVAVATGKERIDSLQRLSSRLLVGIAIAIRQIGNAVHDMSVSIGNGDMPGRIGQGSKGIHANNSSIRRKQFLISCGCYQDKIFRCQNKCFNKALI